MSWKGWGSNLKAIVDEVDDGYPSTGYLNAAIDALVYSKYHATCTPTPPAVMRVPQVLVNANVAPDGHVYWTFIWVDSFAPDMIDMLSTWLTNTIATENIHVAGFDLTDASRKAHYLSSQLQQELLIQVAEAKIMGWFHKPENKWRWCLVKHSFMKDLP